MYNLFSDRNQPSCRSIFSGLLFSSVSLLLISSQAMAYEIDPDATISDSPTTLMGGQSHRFIGEEFGCVSRFLSASFGF